MMCDKYHDTTEVSISSDVQLTTPIANKSAITTGENLFNNLCESYHSKLQELINNGNTLGITNYLDKLKNENNFGVFGKDDFLTIFDFMCREYESAQIDYYCRYLNLFSGLDDKVIGHVVKRINDIGKKSAGKDKIALANAILENIESFKNVKNVIYHSSVEDGTVIITLGGEKFPPIYFGDLPVNFMRILQDGWGNDFLNSLIEKSVNLIISDIKNTIEKHESYLSLLGKDFVNLKLYINNNLIKNIDDLNKSSVDDLLENRLSKILKIEDPVEKIIQLRNLRLRISQFDASYEPYKTFSK